MVQYWIKLTSEFNSINWTRVHNVLCFINLFTIVNTISWIVTDIDNSHNTKQIQIISMVSSCLWHWEKPDIGHMIRCLHHTHTYKYSAWDRSSGKWIWLLFKADSLLRWYVIHYLKWQSLGVFLPVFTFGWWPTLHRLPTPYNRLHTHVVIAFIIQLFTLYIKWQGPHHC